MESKKLPKHLGGHSYKDNMDEEALRFLIQKFSIKSMLDIGCGMGGMVRYAIREHNLDAHGIDGDFTLPPKPWLTVHDFTLGKAPYDRTFDLGLSIEFVEHVVEDYVPNFMDTFSKCKYVLMTHALPGAPGVHHVNCKPEDYWIKVFEKYGLDHDPLVTKEIREASSMVKLFMKDTGKFFRNRNL